MPDALMPTAHDPLVVALSFLVALAASYVALELARRVRSPDRLLALGWGLGGSMAMGTGIWAMHFLGMLAFELPVAVGYAPLPTALSWLAAVLVSLVAMLAAARPDLGRAGLAVAALSMGGGICAMHYIGMAALDFAPGIRWHLPTVAASVAVAVGASAVALGLFMRLDALTPGGKRRGQLLAAAVMALGIGGMHYTGMAAAGFPAGAVCLSAGQLRGDGMALLVAFASMLLLGLTFFSSLLEERMQHRAAKLSDSLSAKSAELQRALLHDPITDLPNRLLFEDRLAQVVRRCERDQQGVALLVVDLDGFKELNDQFGHAAGDATLRQVALRLRRLARQADTLARLSGDEFVLLLDGAPDAAAVHAVALRVQRALQEPFALHGQEVQLSAAIGMALHSADASFDKLLTCAATAMVEAKRQGGARALFFAPDMDSETRELMALKRDLRRAIEQPGRGELSLHYQPKVQALDGRLTGVEALLRWQHPECGAISPLVFIDLAERFGLIEPLGDWVIDEACRQMAQWRNQGLALRVAVNLSMHQLRQAGLVAHVQRALARHGLPAEQLMFEITESTAMTDIDTTLRVFAELAQLGTELSIDDFGTGYSSLAYLRRLPAVQLKIDRSFVKDLDSSADARAIVEAVVRLAHALGLAVVAEGVETEGQRQQLCALQCDELQGYLFSRPVPAATVSAWAEGEPCPPLLRLGLPAWAGRPPVAAAATMAGMAATAGRRPQGPVKTVS
ncbi:putative bifunctional diguanylate cyclase/phosphodiesterase [Aquabacterium sp. OR-4]|uniref:putative bifunctional diguanylate cyclase/phosphodiesterase n=1 Tax=Aquabacterium sp. OR-4 TaxID=2978127 RepID=UPI0021B446F2|nr:EAL domain-containing protein [Aquabacterium sp. OR-4]MDT7837055.1 EAL domain-containing protein [Aquabacterium sp. OR-4]